MSARDLMTPNPATLAPTRRLPLAERYRGLLEGLYR